MHRLMIKTQHKLHFFMLLLVLAVAGCATAPQQHVSTTLIYSHWGKENQFENYAPVIEPQQPQHDYNHIGHAAARITDDNKEEIFIATDSASFYTQRQPFTTSHDNYLNLIYRFHLPRVPLSHLTGGKNGGLFVIITLNSNQEPVLITTVHSCGCYLAFVPTTYLPIEAYPKEWDLKSQKIYGETLPGILDYPQHFSTNWRPLIRLRDGNHRIMDIELINIEQLPQSVQKITVELEPVEQLYNLPLANGTTSFFHHQGRRKGYVKNSFKPWELLLMSWWTLDLHIGSDKALGDPEETGTIFYTSLKPWRRDESNMWYFDRFLNYWGWQL